LIRDSLARHAAALGQADLLVTGTDHRFADLACRERLHLSSDGLAKAAEELGQVLGIHEFMLLNTCNRVELVGLATCTPALHGVVTKVLGLNRLDRSFYVLHGFDAFRHLALVTAGLLSQTPRETHIRAQVKEALDLSRRNGWSAGILHDWVGRALRIGAAVRRETDSILTETEIEDRCVAFLEDAMGGLRHRRLLVVGSGNVGRNVVRDLLTHGASVSWCYHARAPEAVFSNGSQVSMWPMTNLRDGLRGQDAIVCAVSAADPVLTEEQASWLVPGHPVTVVDLGVPRNVAPGFAAGRDNVRVVNLEDLDQWDRRHAARLQEALEVGDRVVKEHVEDYERVVLGIQTGD
jgi:glutamyl-tRNA reductase